MPAIGIVDDRDEVRETMVDGINLILSSDWELVDIAPLEQLDLYPSWISQYEISALVIDEKLNEDYSEEAVDYEGHDLVDYLRRFMPDFPIFVVTSYPDNSDLEARFRHVEDIIARADFVDNPANYIDRITRSGQRYSQNFEEELAELGDFANKSAKGEAISDEERERAIAIQTKLETSFPIEDIASRGEWLSKMERLINDLEDLKDDIERKAGG